MLLCVSRIVVSYRLGGDLSLAICVHETEVGVKVDEGAVCCYFFLQSRQAIVKTPVASMMTIVVQTALGSEIRPLPFNCESHTVGDLRDERFNGS